MTELTPVHRSEAQSRLIWALCIASVVIYINLYTVQGMLPSIAEHFDVSGAKATLVLSVTSFTLAFRYYFMQCYLTGLADWRLLLLVYGFWLHLIFY